VRTGKSGRDDPLTKGRHLSTVVPSDEFHSPTPRICQTGSPSALQSAADLLRAVSCPGDPSYGSDGGELAGAQWRALKAHCESSELIVPLPPDLTKGGAEHDFCLRGDKIWKFTRPYSAGCTVSVDESSCLMLPGSPLQYLDRWLLGNRIFGDMRLSFLVLSTPRKA
jgi:hypothetical protein